MSYSQSEDVNDDINQAVTLNNLDYIFDSNIFCDDDNVDQEFTRIIEKAMVQNEEYTYRYINVTQCVT